VVVMSVYRRHEEKVEVFERELRERIKRVHQRYQGAAILIGGDLNNKQAPKSL